VRSARFKTGFLAETVRKMGQISTHQPFALSEKNIMCLKFFSARIEGRLGIVLPNSSLGHHYLMQKPERCSALT
jgi:hypothetical protein